MNQDKKSRTSRPRGNPKRTQGDSRPHAEEKAGLKVRAAASKLLAAVVDRKISLDGIFDPVHGNPAYKQLSDPDRALTRAILLSALRHLPRIDAALSSLLENPLPEGARALQHVLTVAATQILYLDVPAHAAVDLAVEQAQRDPRNRRFAKLVNAVLRRLVREKQAVLERVAEISPAPEWFMARLAAAYGAEQAEQISEAQLTPPAIDLTVKSDPEKWAELLGGRVLPTGSVRLSTFEGSVTALTGYQEGGWWVQDAAASIPARLFGDVQGKRVADLCAAPGGKTVQLVLAGADVIAVEQSANRLQRLQENLARLDLRAEVIHKDLFDFRPESPLDGVLLDAPCSSTGTTRRHPDVLWTKGPADVAKLAALQARMLVHAISLVKSGGLIVFSNCSLDPLEGEDLVAGVIERHPEVARVPIDPDLWPGLESAITPRGEFRTTPAMLPAAAGSIGGMDGFFACVLRRR